MVVSAVVLAGGRSSRFGRDKLAEPVDGEPMLARTIAALSLVAADIVVVAGPEGSPAVPAGVHVVRDPEAYGGPLIGLVAGLSAARRGMVVVVGGDMPWVRAEVLASLIAALEPAHDVAALAFEGRPQQLPIAVRRDPALTAARYLTETGQRRLGVLLEALDLAVITEDAWRRLDPDGVTVRDVDTPADLAVLDRDLFDRGAGAIGETRCIGTFIDGVAVYEDAALGG
jgi:molybdopterin-guanine dinucleotide biosynthesis protein A